MLALTVALGLVVALLAVLVVGLLRAHADVLRALHDRGVNLDAEAHPRPAVRGTLGGPVNRVEGVPGARSEAGDLGSAQDVVGALPGGGTGRVAVVGVPHNTLLAFLSSTCGTCGAFWEAFDGPGPSNLPGEDVRLVIVTRDPEEEQVSAIVELAPPQITTIMSSAAWEDHDVPVSPYFLLVEGPSGAVVGEGSGTSWPQVSDLLGRALRDRATVQPAAMTRRQVLGGGRERVRQVDEMLIDAGIEPGDPRLYHGEETP